MGAPVESFRRSALLDAMSPDIVILDVEQIVRRIRGIAKYAGVRLLALTGEPAAMSRAVAPLLAHHLPR